MSDTILRQAVIPTNSVRLIVSRVGPSIDKAIQFAVGTCTSSEPVEKRIHKYFTVHKTAMTRAHFRFNREHDDFSMLALLGDMNRCGLHDMWLSELRLRFMHDLGLFDFTFENRSLSSGSPAESFVAEYHASLLKQGLTKRTMIRHMPLTHAITVGRYSSRLDPFELVKPEFIRWLAVQTRGLIKMKTMELVSKDVVRDVGIESLMDGGGR